MSRDPTTPATPTLTRNEIAEAMNDDRLVLRSQLCAMALAFLDLREGVERLATELEGTHGTPGIVDTREIHTVGAFHRIAKALRALPHVVKEKTDG